MEFDNLETDSPKAIHVHIPPDPGPLVYSTQIPWAHLELGVISGVPSKTPSLSFELKKVRELQISK